MRGYFKYLRNQHRDEVMVRTTVSYAHYSETYLKGKDRTINRFYRMDSWNLLRLGKQNKRKMLDINPNENLR